MELAGWGGAADDNDKVSLSAIRDSVDVWLVESGKWSVVCAYLEYLPTTYIDRYRDDVLYLLSRHRSRKYLCRIHRSPSGGGRWTKGGQVSHNNSSSM